MIDVKNINFAYKGEKPLFDNFSLHIEPGLLYGLLGPNGAGKTSLISLISGLNRPSTGQVHINEQSYAKYRPSILSKLSLVPQEYAFYSQLTAYENLHFFANLYNTQIDKKRNIEKAIALTGLNEYKDRRASTFSGGLKRRLNLAIGLLNDPKLLVLDEPTVGIDPQSRRFILEAIQALNEQGTTILYTSHYMHEVEQICQQIAILDHGKVLQQGTLQELLNDNMATTITSSRTIEQDKIDSALRTLLSENNVSIYNRTITARDLSSQDLSELITLLENNKIKINQIRYGQQSLEDLFFDLTKTRLREH